LGLEDRMRLPRTTHAQQMLEDVASAEKFLEDLFRICGQAVLSHEGSILQDSLFEPLLAKLIVNLSFFSYLRKDLPS
jgi:hypothetical protein